MPGYRLAHQNRRRYGVQTLIVDGAGLGVSAIGLGFFLGRSTQGVGAVMLITGGVALSLGAPIVHWARGSVWRGFASLGFRWLLPTLGGLVGLAAASGSSQSVAVLVGSSIGTAAAITLDAAWLARESE